jgi:hypothetical protein
MSPPGNLDHLSHAELKGLVIKQWEQLVELQRMVMVLRDEIARLKGGPGRPNIKPSGMERGTEPKAPGSSGDRKGPRGSTRSKLTVDEERTVKAATPPLGSRFKGYTSFVVQDLVIHSHVVDFRCERWQLPDGSMLTATLPAGIDGHFGPQLRRFVLAQYHQGQTTVPRLVTLLRSLGIFISKRQVLRLLIDGQDDFLTEARDTLRAGLSSAGWITVDDTGARHKAGNGFCTQIGNADFALVRHHRLQEPSQLPPVAARRLRRLRRQCRGAGLHAPTRPFRASDRPLGRASSAVLRRSGRLDRPSRGTRHLGPQGQSGSRDDRDRGGAVGQHQGARLPA